MLSNSREESWSEWEQREGNAHRRRPIRQRPKRIVRRPECVARGIGGRGRRRSVLKRFHGEQLPAESLPVALTPET